MSDQPQFPSDLGDAPYPSARGILDCLRMLADEATALRLAGTADALRAAIAVCVAESEAAESEASAPVIAAPPPGTVLH